MPTRTILVLCDRVGTDGGTESYLARLLPELHRRGVRVVLRARRVDEPDAFGSPASCIAWAADTEAARPSIGEVIRAEIAAVRPDAVLASNVFDPAVIAAAGTAARLFVRVHDHRIFCPQGDRIFPQFRRACEAPMGVGCLARAVTNGCAGGAHKRSLDLLHAREDLRGALRHVERFFVASHFMAASCASNGVAPERVTILPPPCGDESFTRPLAPMPEDRRILFAGRLVRDKGLDSLLRALAGMPAARRPALDVAGAPTPEFSDFERRARHAGVTVRMLGKLSSSEMIAAVDAVRAVAVPSIWPEPFGLVGIEAYARGRPAAAYASGGIVDWIADASLAVRPGDTAALAAAIERVLDEARWPERSAAAVARARDLTPRAHVDLLEAALFDECADLRVA